MWMGAYLGGVLPVVIVLLAPVIFLAVGVIVRLFW